METCPHGKKMTDGRADCVRCTKPADVRLKTQKVTMRDVELRKLIITPIPLSKEADGWTRRLEASAELSARWCEPVATLADIRWMDLELWLEWWRRLNLHLLTAETEGGQAMAARLANDQIANQKMAAANPEVKG